VKHSKSTDGMFEIPQPLHPAIVHFPIVLIFLGAVLSALTIITRRGALPQFAAAILILAAGTAQLAVNTGGDQADEVVKRMPQARRLILVHAEWGEWVRTTAVIAAISAVLALAFYRFTRFRRFLAVVTTLIAGAACYCALQAGQYGGKMVYHHGVGVETTAGNTGATQTPSPGTQPPASSSSPTVSPQ
jgi:uncharacterized membrane protein